MRTIEEGASVHGSAEDFAVLGGGGGPGEALAVASDGGRICGGGELGVEGGDEGVEIVGDAETAKDGVVEHLRDAADAGGDHGEAGGEGLEDHIRNAFVFAGEGEEIGGVHEAGDFGRGLAAGEDDPRGETELCGEIAAGLLRAGRRRP